MHFTETPLHNLNPIIPQLHLIFNNPPADSACQVAKNIRKAKYLCEEGTFFPYFGTPPPLPTIQNFICDDLS